MPAPSQAVAASSGLGGGPFAAMMNAFMQAGIETYGFSMVPPNKTLKHRSATLEADAPLLTYGPFSRKASHGSVRSDASHAATELDESQAPTERDASPAATERDDDEGSDELAKHEAAMAKSKKAVEKTSASDPAAGKIAKRPAASIAKRPASIAKRPAAACGEFDIETWAAENPCKAEALSTPKRDYFTSRIHHRSFNAAKKAGMSDDEAKEVRSQARTKAGAFYDLVHKHG